MIIVCDNVLAKKKIYTPPVLVTIVVTMEEGIGKSSRTIVQPSYEYDDIREKWIKGDDREVDINL